MPLTFEPLSSGRKSAAIVHQLAGTIAAGDLRPGQRLPSEPEMAKEFEVSRGVVREAIRMLETMGLLEVRRGYGGGTFVGSASTDEYRPVPPAPLDTRDVVDADLLAVRLELEGLAAREAAGAARGTDMELRRPLLQARLGDERPGVVIGALADFHQALAGASGNRLLSDLAAGLRPAVLQVLHRRAWDAGWRSQAVAELEHVVDLVARGDADGAAGALRTHIRERQHGR